MTSSFEPFDPESFQIIQQSLLSYIQSEYVYGPAEANATCELFFLNLLLHLLNRSFFKIYETNSPIPLPYSSFAHMLTNGSLFSPIYSPSYDQPQVHRIPPSIATFPCYFSIS